MPQFPEVVFSPTIVTGARAAGNDIVSQRIKPDVADEIFSYQPNGNAVALLTTKARKKREVSQFQFYFLTKDRLVGRTRINLAAGYDADDTSIVVDAGNVGYARAIGFNTRSLERFLIGSVSGNTWTIATRGLGSTAAAMNDNDEIQIIGDSYPENADVGTAISIQEAAEFNYTQTLRTPFAFSRRDMDTEMFGGSDVTSEEKWQMSQHAQKIEHSFFWGARDSFNDATSAKRNTTMGGAHFFLQNRNEWDLNAVAFNERNFIEYLEESMYYGKGGRFGSRKKWLFAADRYITEVNAWGLDKIRLVPKADVLGLEVFEYASPHGRVMLVPHPLFEGDNADKAFLLDMNHIRYVYHRGGDTQLLRNRGTNGTDGKTHEWLSDVSIEFQLYNAHGFVHGISL